MFIYNTANGYLHHMLICIQSSHLLGSILSPVNCIWLSVCAFPPID